MAMAGPRASPGAAPRGALRSRDSLRVSASRGGGRGAPALAGMPPGGSGHPGGAGAGAGAGKGGGAGGPARQVLVVEHGHRGAGGSAGSAGAGGAAGAGAAARAERRQLLRWRRSSWSHRGDAWGAHWWLPPDRKLTAPGGPSWPGAEDFDRATVGAVLGRGARAATPPEAPEGGAGRAGRRLEFRDDMARMDAGMSSARAVDLLHPATVGIMKRWWRSLVGQSRKKPGREVVVLLWRAVLWLTEDVYDASAASKRVQRAWAERQGAGPGREVVDFSEFFQSVVELVSSSSLAARLTSTRMYCKFLKTLYDRSKKIPFHLLDMSFKSARERGALEASLAKAHKPRKRRTISFEEAMTMARPAPSRTTGRVRSRLATATVTRADTAVLPLHPGPRPQGTPWRPLDRFPRLNQKPQAAGFRFTSSVGTQTRGLKQKNRPGRHVLEGASVHHRVKTMHYTAAEQYVHVVDAWCQVELAKARQVGRDRQRSPIKGEREPNLPPVTPRGDVLVANLPHYPSFLPKLKQKKKRVVKSPEPRQKGLRFARAGTNRWHGTGESPRGRTWNAR